MSNKGFEASLTDENQKRQAPGPGRGVISPAVLQRSNYNSVMALPITCSNGLPAATAATSPRRLIRRSGIYRPGHRAPCNSLLEARRHLQTFLRSLAPVPGDTPGQRLQHPAIHCVTSPNARLRNRAWPVRFGSPHGGLLPFHRCDSSLLTATRLGVPFKKAVDDCVERPVIATTGPALPASGASARGRRRRCLVMVPSIKDLCGCGTFGRFPGFRCSRCGWPVYKRQTGSSPPSSDVAIASQSWAWLFTLTALPSP